MEFGTTARSLLEAAKETGREVTVYTMDGSEVKGIVSEFNSDGWVKISPPAHQHGKDVFKSSGNNRLASWISTSAILRIDIPDEVVRQHPLQKAS